MSSIRSSGISTWKGRISVASADFSVMTDIGGSSLVETVVW
jgi:hypothetical protein